MPGVAASRFHCGDRRGRGERQKSEGRSQARPRRAGAAGHGCPDPACGGTARCGRGVFPSARQDDGLQRRTCATPQCTKYTQAHLRNEMRHHNPQCSSELSAACACLRGPGATLHSAFMWIDEIAARRPGAAVAMTENARPVGWHGQDRVLAGLSVSSTVWVHGAAPVGCCEGRLPVEWKGIACPRWVERRGLCSRCASQSAPPRLSRRPPRSDRR